MTVPTIAPPSTATMSAPGACASSPPTPARSSVLDGSAVASTQNARIAGMSSEVAGRSAITPRNLRCEVMSFRGWPKDALEFYVGLEADNSKAYWLAHKSVYDESVKAPFLALSEAI